MTVAEYLANQLINTGIKYVFGIPGGPSIPYLEAFRAAGIEFILVSNEASAGYMAEVSGRLTGIPGVCHATYGPGATNISTGVGGALLDRSPVIVLTSEMDDKMLRRTTQMNIDHQKLFEPLTKATFRMTRANAAEVINSAIHICQEDYPGPVHIGLPVDIATLEIIEAAVPQRVVKTRSQSNDINRITDLLEKSRRPLIAAGLTAARENIGDDLMVFLNRYKIPVVVTPMAKGLISEDHQSYAGVLFHALSDYLEDIFEKTDLVIGLGYDPVEYNYESWMPDVPLVHFDRKEADISLRGSLAQYIGAPAEWFDILNNLLAGSLVFESGLLQGVRDEMVSVFNGFTNHFGPVTALKVLQEEIPADSIVTADVGSHLHLIGQFWKTHGKRNLIMTNGWSGMGFGIPAALAVQINDPDSTVICITGDGGFLMTAGEIATARRYNLPVIIVVISDSELNLIKVKQSWQNLPPYGTLLFSGDMFGADTFLGVRVINSESEDKMRDAIIQALSIREPVIINAIVDPEDYNWLIVRK